MLVDPANMVKNTVTIPEGLRVTEIVDVLADKTDFPQAAYEQGARRTPARSGLPDVRRRQRRGLPVPVDLRLRSRRRPRSRSSRRWSTAGSRPPTTPDLEDAAAELGYDPGELMIVASLVEAEAAVDEDRAKVARVIYNRLEGDETNGLLQIDATVNYGLTTKLGVAPDDRAAAAGHAVQHLHAGRACRRRPIEAPGDAAIAAAAHPADGGWYYYVTTNLRTGETKFAETYDEFLGYKRRAAAVLRDRVVPSAC